MFGNSRKPHLIEVSKLSSLIAEDVEMDGDLIFASGLRVDGFLHGKLVGKPGEGKARSLLVLSDKGRIEGSIRCYDAVINGTVQGDLEVEHFLELQANARVSGTIRYCQLQMDVGAIVDGQLIQRDVQQEARQSDDKVVELSADKARSAS